MKQTVILFLDSNIMLRTHNNHSFSDDICDRYRMMEWEFTLNCLFF